MPERYGLPYGCGCAHDCGYCYAKSLLDFRKLWNPENPRIADIRKIERTIQKLPQGSVVRMGGMSDCFQPIELKERVALDTIKLLNRYRIGYLLVTKSHILAEPEYLSVMDPNLAHIQISVTCLDDEKSALYENASPPSKRVESLLTLQRNGFDAAIRLSPLIPEYMDFGKLNSLGIDKCIAEFLRVNHWIKQWFPLADYDKYTLRESNYLHLPLEEKIRILSKIHIKNISVCEDVTEHYEYWKANINPNPQDCCNLRF